MRLLVALLLASTAQPVANAAAQTGSGTVVLVALDGFHPSYLDRAPARHLRKLASEGVRARWLTPVFPSLTFPNFYSIATGLYPEHHGIVSNTINDSVLDRFSLRDTAVVHDPRWWGGVPIWVTAERQGKREAKFFWPRSDEAVDGEEPNYYQVFNPKIPKPHRERHGD